MADSNFHNNGASLEGTLAVSWNFGSCSPRRSSNLGKPRSRVPPQKSAADFGTPKKPGAPRCGTKWEAISLKKARKSAGNLVPLASLSFWFSSGLFFFSKKVVLETSHFFFPVQVALETLPRFAGPKRVCFWRVCQGKDGQPWDQFYRPQLLELVRGGGPSRKSLPSRVFPSNTPKNSQKGALGIGVLFGRLA